MRSNSYQSDSIDIEEQIRLEDLALVEKRIAKYAFTPAKILAWEEYISNQDSDILGFETHDIPRIRDIFWSYISRKLSLDAAYLEFQKVLRHYGNAMIEEAEMIRIRTKNSKSIRWNFKVDEMNKELFSKLYVVCDLYNWSTIKTTKTAQITKLLDTTKIPETLEPISPVSNPIKKVKIDAANLLTTHGIAPDKAWNFNNWSKYILDNKDNPFLLK